MVNNHHREADHHPPLFFTFCCFLVLALCLMPGVVSAQKIKNHYVSSMQQKGTLYFIRPQKGFKNQELGSRFLYDITCFSATDSVTFNFSYFDKNVRNLDSIYLLTGSKKFSAPVARIFVETKKSSWHYRFTARFALNDIQAFFNEKERGTITLVDRSTPIPLRTNKKKWKKYAAINTKIIQLIRYNK